jgi:hypothetical protein
MTCPVPLVVKNAIVTVTVSLGGADCGAVWLRLGPAEGFRVVMCTDQVFAGIDSNDHEHPRTLAQQRLWGDVPVGHLMIVATGPYLDLTVNGTPVLRTGFTDRLLPAGGILLGSVPDPRLPTTPAGDAAPDSRDEDVLFTGLRVWQP